MALLASTLASFAASMAVLLISRLNYPGATALNRMHVLARDDTGVVKVHMDRLACMTGVTRFLEMPPPPLDAANGTFWVYDKTEDKEKLLDPMFWEGMDYVLAEKPERIIGSWDVLDTVEGFAGVGIVKPGVEEKEADPVRAIQNVCARALERESVSEWDECEDMLFGSMEAMARKYVTRGWWVRVKMEPRIKILGREKEVLWEEIFEQMHGHGHRLEHGHDYEHGYGHGQDNSATMEI